MVVSSFKGDFISSLRVWPLGCGMVSSARPDPAGSPDGHAGDQRTEGRSSAC